MKRPASRKEDKDGGEESMEEVAESEQPLGEADGHEDIPAGQKDPEGISHEDEGQELADEGGPPSKRARTRVQRTSEEKEVQAMIKSLSLEKYVATRLGV